MKNWTVGSLIAEAGGREIYSVSRNNKDGSVTNAKLTRIIAKDELYTKDNISFFKDEAEFLKSISKIEGASNYIDASVSDMPDSSEIDVYIITDDSKPLSEYNPYNAGDERDVVEFGLKMSEVLDKLESKNIYHGNIKPENIFVREDGSLCLGGFTELESPVDSRDFLAPEIANDENPDFTTDIYSLGLIMYKMCNSGKLPFEANGASREEAIAKRLSGSSVSAPANGSEKLKSVIVIACQPGNKNRWKNAGNLKNALSSIKSELPASQPVKAAAVIVPGETDFDGNVFEEYDFEETVEQETENKSETTGAAQIEDAQSVSPEEKEPEDKPAQNTGDDNSEDEVTSSYTEPEIDNRVFDDYETETKIFNIQDAQTEEKKDYGDFFDDDEIDSGRDNTPESDNSEDTDSFGGNTFGYDEEEDDEEKKGKKGLIAAIIIAAVIILALLGVLGFIAFKNGWFKGSGGNETATTAPTEIAATTAAPQTTVPATTVPATTKEQPTTASDEKAMISVIGFGYYYAEEVLSAEGYEVAISEYKYSDDYEEGLVIEQSPEEGASVKDGDTVYLTVSLGAEEEETTAPAEKPEDRDSDNQSAFSSYKNNTSYLSQSEVDAMSEDELNIAINEIYARRGRIFTSPDLAAYFNAQSWYKPLYTAEEFSQKVVFNDYEAKNITLLYNEQVERGYR